MKWVEIPGFRGRYRVSDHGVVQTNAGGYWRDLATQIDRAGYARVYLWDSAKKERVGCLIHRLVARSFLPSNNDRLCVNHINGTKLDNHVANLEWCTRSDNMRHAWRTGLCKPLKLTAGDVRDIRTCSGLDTDVARHYGVSQVLVTKIRASKIWRSVP